MKKLFATTATILSVLGAANAEPQRALLTHENKFPALHQVEVGALANYSEYDTRDERAIGPYARYGLWQNLTLNAGLPFREISPEFGDNESGIGDTTVGLELKAWEDVFEYPYVIPHVDVTFSTGDEDEGLGAGETITKFGVSLGTVTYETLHWVADVSYAVNGGREQPDPDNVFILAGSLIWDISKQFAVLVEGSITDEDNPEDDIPAFVQGGMVYKWTADFLTGFYFGAERGTSDNRDGSATIKAAYTF
jgi:hypothetical protein